MRVRLRNRVSEGAGGTQAEERGDEVVVVVVMARERDSRSDAGAGQGEPSQWPVWESFLRHHRRRRWCRPRGQIGSHKVTWRKWIDRSNAADRNVAPIRIGYSGACAVADQDPIARFQLGSPGDRREARASVYQRRPLVTNHREREAAVIYGRGILIIGHDLVCGCGPLIAVHGRRLASTRDQT